MPRRSLVRSFYDAFVGIAHVMKTQRNMKIQAAIAVLIAAAAMYLRVPLRDCAILAMTMAVVLAGEAANTVVEVLVDELCPGPSESARIAKDMAAGAVLLLALGAAFVGLLLLGPPLWQCLFNWS